MVDRSFGGPVMMASSEGGMDIEEVAANTPDKILKAPFGSDGKLDEQASAGQGGAGLHEELGGGGAGSGLARACPRMPMQSRTVSLAPVRSHVLLCVPACAQDA